MYDSSYADMATFASVATLASLISTYSLIILAFYVLIIVAQWKIFTKAGQEGWKALIPIYNVVVLYKIIGLSPWLLLLYLLSVVPVVGWIISIALSIVSTVKLYCKTAYFFRRKCYTSDIITAPINTILTIIDTFICEKYF